MPHVLITGSVRGNHPKGDQYELYHKRYYKVVVWEAGGMTHRGLEFRPRKFKTLKRVHQEARMFSGVMGVSSTMVKLPDGRYTFLPSNAEQDKAISRMCDLLGASIVDYYVSWSL